MESMGSKLSPGAQQLMSLVRFQQQQMCIPIGEPPQSPRGSAGSTPGVGAPASSSSGASAKSTSTPFPFRTGLTSGNRTEDVQAHPAQRTQPAAGGPVTRLQECPMGPQNQSLLENELKAAVSSFSPKRAGDSAPVANSELPPFLQNLCRQVSHLRLGPHSKWQESITRPGEGPAGLPEDAQCICSSLEKMLSKNMELMEKKLTDYIDQRIYKLQEHLDNKIALLVDLLQNPNSPPSGMPLRHYDSGERLSNGER